MRSAAQQACYGPLLGQIESKNTFPGMTDKCLVVDWRGIHSGKADTVFFADSLGTTSILQFIPYMALRFLGTVRDLETSSAKYKPLPTREKRFRPIDRNSSKRHGSVASALCCSERRARFACPVASKNAIQQLVAGVFTVLQNRKAKVHQESKQVVSAILI